MNMDPMTVQTRNDQHTQHIKSIFPIVPKNEHQDTFSYTFYFRSGPLLVEAPSLEGQEKNNSDSWSILKRILIVLFVLTNVGMNVGKWEHSYIQWDCLVSLSFLNRSLLLIFLIKQGACSHRLFQLRKPNYENEFQQK